MEIPHVLNIWLIDGTYRGGSEYFATPKISYNFVTPRLLTNEYINPFIERGKTMLTTETALRGGID